MSARVPRTLCVPRWPSNFSLSPPEIIQAVEIAFDSKEGPQPSEFITEADLKARRLSLSEGPRVVVEEASPSTTTILPAINASPKTSASPRDGYCHDLFYWLFLFCLAHSFTFVY